jgi:hypothetical protein
LALHLQIPSPVDEHSRCPRLPDEHHDHPIASDGYIDLPFWILDTLSPEETLDISFGGLNLLAPGHKPASHVDNPDIRVVVLALNAADVESGSGKEPRQAAMMVEAVEAAFGQELF